MQISWWCSVRLCLEYLVHNHWPTFGPGLSSSLVLLLYTCLCGPPSIFDLPPCYGASQTHKYNSTKYCLDFRIEYPTSETLSQFQDACFFLHTHKRRWISGDQRWQLFQVEIFGKSWNNFASYVFCRVMPTKCSSRDLQRKWIMGLHRYYAIMCLLFLILSWRKIQDPHVKKKKKRLKRFRFGLTLTWCKADSTYVHQSILG